MSETCVPPGMLPEDSGFGYTLSLIGGKYKMLIIYWLAENRVVRFNELKRSIGVITFKICDWGEKDRFDISLNTGNSSDM